MWSFVKQIFQYRNYKCNSFNNINTELFMYISGKAHISKYKTNVVKQKICIPKISLLELLSLTLKVSKSEIWWQQNIICLHRIMIIIYLITYFVFFISQHVKININKLQDINVNLNVNTVLYYIQSVYVVVTSAVQEHFFEQNRWKSVILPICLSQSLCSVFSFAAAEHANI